MADPGPLIGRGRAADVFDIGGGRVVRRYRAGGGRHGLVLTEAAAMRHLAAHGFPVPAIHDADGFDLVMERLAGVSMLTALERRPWKLGRLADQWAELHRQLAAVPVGALADAGLPVRFGAPAARPRRAHRPAPRRGARAARPTCRRDGRAATGPAPGQ